MNGQEENPIPVGLDEQDPIEIRVKGHEEFYEESELVN